MTTRTQAVPPLTAEEVVGDWFDKGYEAGRLDTPELLSRLRPVIEAEARQSAIAELRRKVEGAERYEPCLGAGCWPPMQKAPTGNWLDRAAVLALFDEETT